MFNFGNEFCRKDPLPGNRKTLNVNVTCVSDELIHRVVEFTPEEADRRTKSVLNVVFESLLDRGIEDFENIQLVDR